MVVTGLQLVSFAGRTSWQSSNPLYVKPRGSARLHVTQHIAQTRPRSSGGTPGKSVVSSSSSIADSGLAAKERAAVAAAVRSESARGGRGAREEIARE